MENREQVVAALIGRVCEQAPIGEIIRVYSEAVFAAVNILDDNELINSIAQAGFTDILETFELVVPDEVPQAEGITEEMVESL